MLYQQSTTGCPRCQVPEQDVWQPVDALRGVGSSLSDPCRGANGGRDVEYGSLKLLFTSHPGPTPDCLAHQLLHGGQKRQLA